MKADIIIDLAYGDSGKGKVSKHLSNVNKYSHCLRFNGGPNAGHTIYHNGQKLVTHQIPCGIFHGVKSIIGATCVINVNSLFEEIKMIESVGVDVKKLLKIAKNAHIITEKHLNEDGKDAKIGTTKRGIGPCYSDKCLRSGIRAESIQELQPYLIDVFEELNNNESYTLCEGAQGFYLDIDWGDYPYVTSSQCTIASVIQNGITYSSINNVYGVIKAYETYVGAKQFEPNEDIFNNIRNIGGEFGATTGRPRQCNWINLNNLERAIKFNGVTNLIVNKFDILENIGIYKLILNNQVIECDTESFKNMLIKVSGLSSDKIIFSRSPEEL